MRKIVTTLIIAGVSFSVSRAAMAQTPGKTILKGGPGAPIIFTLVGNSGGTRVGKAKDTLALFLTGGTLSATQSLQFNLTAQPASLKFISHNGSARSRTSFEIIAVVGGNMLKAPKASAEEQNARLTIVAQGGGNRRPAKNEVVVTGGADSPITLALINHDGASRAGVLWLVISGGNLPAGKSVQFDLAQRPTSLRVISTNGSNLEIVAAGGDNMTRGRAPVRPLDSTRLTLVATGGGN